MVARECSTVPLKRDLEIKIKSARKEAEVIPSPQKQSTLLGRFQNHSIMHGVERIHACNKEGEGACRVPS